MNPQPDQAEAVEATTAPKTSLRHPLALVYLGLTFVTGLVDAVSYLGLGRVFSANMTGNVVLLGFGIAQSGGLPIIAPLVSLFAFLVGAVIGGRLAIKAAHRRRFHLRAALGLEFTFIVAAAVVCALVHVKALSFAGDAVIGLLALGMGIRNATVRRISMPDLTTTVLTMTLTGLAADSYLGGGTGELGAAKQRRDVAVDRRDRRSPAAEGRSGDHARRRRRLRARHRDRLQHRPLHLRAGRRLRPRAAIVPRHLGPAQSATSRRLKITRAAINGGRAKTTETQIARRIGAKVKGDSKRACQAVSWFVKR